MRTRLSLAKAARMRGARLSEMSQTQTKILQLVDAATIAVTARGRGPAGVLGKTLAVSVTRNTHVRRSTAPHGAWERLHKPLPRR